MVTTKGIRERARADITAEILTEARRQLATDGAAALSLRAIARELGMVSSGIYRYVASRDDLLTTLIIEAYDALGAAAESAARRTARRPPADRMLATCRAIRAWALDNPQEYALIYGSPVPGYQAPVDTIGPASRVSLALVGITADAHRVGRLAPPPDVPIEVPPALRRDLDAMNADLGLDLPPEVIARLLAAWTQVFGLISFELFGQTHNMVHAHDALFDTTTLAMARFIGLAAA